MRRGLLIISLFWLLLAWCSINITKVENNIIQATGTIQEIISWSNTLKNHSNILNNSVFSIKKWIIEVSTGNRNIMIRWTYDDINTNWITVESKTGTIAISLMTYNPTLINALEPQYKWPFTNNIIRDWEKINYSKDSLSGYVDINDKYLFILISNISTWVSSFEYSIDKK